MWFEGLRSPPLRYLPTLWSCSPLTLLPRAYTLLALWRTKTVRYRTTKTGGNICETGYLEPLPEDLAEAPGLEFGEPVENSIPDTAPLKVSVIYSLGHGEEKDDVLLGASLDSVAKYFPKALEVVILVSNEHLEKNEALKSLLRAQKQSAPFPVHIVKIDDGGRASSERTVAIPPIEDQNRLKTWLYMKADAFCKGDYVLHLEPTGILFEEIINDNVFRVAKPVMLFDRYPQWECEC